MQFKCVCVSERERKKKVEVSHSFLSNSVNNTGRDGSLPPCLAARAEPVSAQSMEGFLWIQPIYGAK